MNNWEISKVMRHFPSTKNCFMGVFPSDRIPKDIPFYPCCFIANTDPSWMPGTHWVAVFVENNANIEYFDSYGRRPMSPQMKEFCGTSYQHNLYAVQSIFSTLCGYFCIYYLVNRCRGNSFSNIMYNFNLNNAVFNENLVKRFVKVYPKVCAKNTRYFIKQICKSRK